MITATVIVIGAIALATLAFALIARSGKQSRDKGGDGSAGFTSGDTSGGCDSGSGGDGGGCGGGD